MDLVIGMVLGAAAISVGWVVGQFIYILKSDDRFDVWDDDDW